ncbi:hypothetical protein PTSG_11047 [Salpingoeca rosetta]|uniref:Uncharacterized protein n=1 Tax=Salpingoeca rosetta (strain ATCC 50818 / BSB-021) TaxID=946362 RepID=F2URZ8_SALR5|nr:uncharacterized protein PTSG_11047 [Salpingoeca rosetta]EGD80403.1 hypothetical protein PTSG_11047 [Salpingoeca rosetta]|eukprot:XP_004987967.1 hypothetical protein PTSG_11047 [Salpingoeca rosetta]
MTRPPSTVCKPCGHCRRRVLWLATPSSMGVTIDRSTSTADTSTLGGLLHGGCKWISGVAADNGVFPATAFHATRHPSSSCDGIPCNSPSILIVDAAASAVGAAVLSVPEVRRVPPAQAGNTSSASGALSLLVLDAMRNHLPKLQHGRDTVLVCACRWFGEERMGREGKAEEEFNTHTYTQLALETKFGLIVDGFGDHSFSPTRACWTGRRSASAFPEHRLLERPRILRSIPEKVVEMMQRRVVFVFEEFFKSLSTQVHTALESARINLFSGDNAWQRALEPAAVTPSPSTNHHHCSGGMNRRALPCDDHSAMLVRLRKQQHQLTPHHPTKQASHEQPAAYLPLSSSPSLAAITTTTTTTAANTPSTADAAAAENAPPPASLAAEHIPQPTNPSPTAAGCLLVATGGDSTSCIFGWKQQQAELSPPPSPRPSTAQPPSHFGRHELQSGVRQTLHMSVALMKSVGEAHEAVAPTTMTMTSDEAAAAAMDVEVR